jgi:opacity protein-like surface antigen
MINILHTEAQIFHGGVLLGFTASQVDGDSYAGYDKLGLQGGVFIKTSLAKNLDARQEIRYASRGARNPASDDNTGSYFLALHYIDLPVSAAIKIKEYGSFEIGMIPGYLFAVNGEKDNGILVDSFHKFDLGTLIGIHVNITEKISLNARYSYSIFSIRDREEAGFYYSWFGKIFGHSRGDFNNYLGMAIHYQIK